MFLDIRLPIGLLFALLGALLGAFGLATNGNRALYQLSLGININLWWGAAMLGFGLIMIALGRSRRRALPPDSSGAAVPLGEEPMGNVPQPRGH